MKTAIITSKNSITGQLENEGEAILLTPMDHRQGETFYELRFVGENITHCRWVSDSDIKIEGDL